MADRELGSGTKGQGVLAGAIVAVRTRYLDEQWARGYEIAEVLPGGYRVRRRGSREVLSDVFQDVDVRADGDR
jgi:hypothetical protein